MHNSCFETSIYNLLLVQMDVLHTGKPCAKEKRKASPIEKKDGKVTKTAGTLTLTLQYCKY